MAVDKSRSLLDAESINTALMELCMSKGKDEKRRVKALEAILDRSTPDFHCRDSTNGRTPLIWAICLNHVATWRLLVARGCGVTATDRDFDRTPLMWAAEKGSWMATEAILDTLPGRRLINARDIEGKTALDLAEQRGHHKTRQVLLDHGAETRPLSGNSAPMLVELPGTGDMSD
jgi:ankyrin repeat protein